MEKAGRTQVILGVLALIAFVILIGIGEYTAGKKLLNRLVKESVAREVEQVTKGYQDEVDRLNRLIKEKDTLLKLSEQRYTTLVGKIREKAAEADTIKKPEGGDETRKRFGSLGYKPTR